MNDFFSKERRIDENQKRLRELFEQYKKTENYYALFVAYLTAISIYYFDFLSLILQDEGTTLFIVLTTITSISIAYTLYLIWIFFKVVPWHFDFLPNQIYEDYPNEIIHDNNSIVVDSDDFKEELLNRYIKDIEGFVQKDLDLYTEKKNRLSKIWTPMAISILLYASCIVTYKTTVVNRKANIYDNKTINYLNITTMSPKPIIVKESRTKIGDSVGKQTNKNGEQSSRKTYTQNEKNEKKKK
jgi:hypothetical protein